MASRNAAALLAAVHASSRGDAEAFVALTHPDAEAETLRSAVQGPWRGHEGMRSFARDTAESFELFEPTFSEIEELAGNRLLAIGSIRVRGSGGGVELEVPTAALVEFRDGLIYRYKDYGDADAARAAVG